MRRWAQKPFPAVCNEQAEPQHIETSTQRQNLTHSGLRTTQDSSVAQNCNSALMSTRLTPTKLSLISFPHLGIVWSQHCTALATLLLKTPCQAHRFHSYPPPLLFLSSPLLSSPLASLLCLHEGILFFFCCPMPVSAARFPPYLPHWWTKESNMPFYFYYFYFHKSVGKFAMKIIENKKSKLSYTFMSS